MKLVFTRKDLQRLVEPAQFERGSVLADTIDDLYEDEWSLCATVLDGARHYEAMVHHGDRRLSAECDCPEGGPPSFCVHSIAVGLYYLGEVEDT
jgi:uncharacterized Zn finger protein